MALVSGGRSSTLNPNAPLFIPAAFRRVEDFSPEWWELVKTSSWYRDYWNEQNYEEDDVFDEFVEDDIVDFLPESIDLGVDEDLVYYEEFVPSPKESSKPRNGLVVDVEGLIKDQTLAKTTKERTPKSPMGSPSPVYFEKRVKPVNARMSPRIIHQPR